LSPEQTGTDKKATKDVGKMEECVIFEEKVSEFYAALGIVAAVVEQGQDKLLQNSMKSAHP